MSLGTITPTAIDALVRVDWVQVMNRHRRRLGDLEGLARSIAEIGLLNPITLTRTGRLIAGQRRLEACRLLGWADIPVRFADNLDDATKLLHAERDENTCREDMLPSELASLGEALYAIEAEAAKARQRNGQERGRVARHGLVEGTRTPNHKEAIGKTTDAVGEALGMAGRTYQELRFVHGIAVDTDAPIVERDLALQALQAMDQGAGIAGEARRLRSRLRARHDAQQTKAATTAEQADDDPTIDRDRNWVPGPNEKNREAVRRRREVIAELAPRGYTSEQIGERLGINEATIRRIAREEGITIPADEALAGTHRRIDSNRIIRETIHDLDSVESVLNLVNYDELDPAQIDGWTASLSKSIRVLNRLNKRLKEMAQP